MSDRIAHRPPDAAGTWAYEDDRVVPRLGRRGLSILALSSAADQPSRMIRRQALPRLVQEETDGREDRSKLEVWRRHAQALGVAA